MIKRIVEKVQSIIGRKSPKSSLRIIPKDDYKIDRSKISPFAFEVCRKLKKAGYEAFIVGGAVRDLLLGRQPKDFDIATNATPEQVRKVTKRAVIIGRRFRLVHVMKGSEIIEVSTYRAGSSAATKDDAGRVISDNVWGTQSEDAERRDFTVNDLYYDPVVKELRDYHGGFEDLQNKTLRMIGEARVRYEEDPVRILRAIRLSSKLGFEIEPGTAKPISKMSKYLEGVPEARLFDEMVKMFTSGASVECVENLAKFKIKIPLLAELACKYQDDAFVQKAFRRCDERIKIGKSVSQSFILAVLLWPAIRELREKWPASWENISILREEVTRRALALAGKSSMPKHVFYEAADIIILLKRFEYRSQGAIKLTYQPKFRAAYDFLLVQASVGEVPHEIADWWTAFEGSGEEDRLEMLREVQREVRQRRRAQAAEAVVDGEALEEPSDGILSSLDKPKRRRRRKRPSFRKKPAGTALTAARKEKSESEAAESMAKPAAPKEPAVKAEKDLPVKPAAPKKIGARTRKTVRPRSVLLSKRK